MKNVLLCLLFITLSVAIFAVPGVTAETANKPFQITSNSSTVQTLHFTLPAWKLSSISKNGQEFKKVESNTADWLIKEGMPELPTYHAMLAIPYQGSVSVKVTSCNERRIPVNNYYPSQGGDETLGNQRSFSMNEDYYNHGGLYPAQTLEVSEPSILREVRYVNVQMNPVSYDAATRELVIRDNITCSITYNNHSSANEMPTPTTYSEAFRSTYEASILNFNEIMSRSATWTAPRVLIIYGNTTDTAIISKLNDFVTWKKQKGYDVNAVSTSTTGNSNSSIKAYIVNTYNSPQTKPDYIILFGDTGFVPTWNVFGGSGDYPYTMMNGSSDTVGDIFIGRFSFENSSDLGILMSKMYSYEKFPNMSNPDWYNKMLLVGDSAHSGISTYYTNYYIKEVSKFANPAYTFTEMLMNGPAPSSMNQAINGGIGFFNYRGYLGMSSWSPSAAELTNVNKTPHAVIITCGTGNFDSSTPSTTEAFMRLGTAAAPKGAVTAIGMATSSTHTLFNNSLNCGIFEGIMTYGMRTMGQALLSGKINLDKSYRQSQPDNTNSFAQWCNLMGDPTLEVYITAPKTYSVTSPDSLYLGTRTFMVTVRDTDQNVASGAIAVVTNSAGLYDKTVTDEAGNAYFELPANASGPLQLVVSQHNYAPFIKSIPFATCGAVNADNIVYDDDNTGSSIGNSNSVINAGETIELRITVNNTSNQALSNGSMVISSTDPYLTITTNSVSIASLAAGATALLDNPFVVRVAPNTPNGYQAVVTATVRDASNMWTYPILLPVNNAAITPILLVIADGGNLTLDPGETAHATITIKNQSQWPLSDVYASLTSLNSMVTVTDSTGYYGDVAAYGTSVNSTNQFELQARISLVKGMQIPLQLRVYNNTGFSTTETINLSIGQVTQADPLGPDSYGYLIYDTSDTAYDDCPTYDWIEISPTAGGTGTVLNLNDAYYGSDEGDQVGAQTLAPVTLPFAFKFYGRDYTHITVCTNGFLALGTTQNGDFRNWRIPGGGSPNPMIAPMWDDLATTNESKICTKYDETLHAFIIEWYKMVNGFTGDSEETFQVILYDPQYAVSMSGDGPIKIQYKVFNNVDEGSSSYPPTHGNHCTIGIKDHTGTIGLEYTYNDNYPTAARPITNQTALYITGQPIPLEQAYLVLGNAYIADQNSNHSIEAGEIVNLGLELYNMGASPANNVTLVASTDDPFVTLINNQSTYVDIPANGTKINNNYISFKVSPDCPNAHQVRLAFRVQIDGDFWFRNYSFTVTKPSITLHSVLINDESGNGNGIAEPGEDIKLVMNFRNNGPSKITGLKVKTISSDDLVQVDQPIRHFGAVEENKIVQKSFLLHLSTSLPSIATINLTCQVVSDNADSIQLTVPLQIGTTIYSESFEDNNGDYTATSGWTWGSSSYSGAHSGTKVWGTILSDFYSANANYELISEDYPIGNNASLSFYHRFHTEPIQDGGNVSISTDGGANWTVLTPNTPYSTSYVASLSAPGYSGTLTTWTPVFFNLSAYQGQLVRFKWRFTSNATSSNFHGWFIDDVNLNGVNFGSGRISGSITLNGGTNNASIANLSLGTITTHPEEDGTYNFYVSSGLYDFHASALNYTSSSITALNLVNNGTLDNGNTILNLLNPATSIHYTHSAGNRVTIHWTAPTELNPNFQYYRVYKKFSTYLPTVAIETPNTSLTEVFDIDGDYQYYVTAVYADGESPATDTLTINWPNLDNEDTNAIAPTFALAGNYPNPFNPSTTIRFSIPKDSKTSLKVYNIRGQLVKTLISGNMKSGSHQCVWDGKSDKGNMVASGIYLFRLESAGKKQTHKAIMMK